MSYRYLFFWAMVLVIGLIAIYPALQNAREIMYGVPGL